MSDLDEHMDDDPLPDYEENDLDGSGSDHAVLNDGCSVQDDLDEIHSNHEDLDPAEQDGTVSQDDAIVRQPPVPDPTLPPIPPVRSAVKPAKTGHYIPTPEIMEFLQELFSLGVMDKKQFDARRKETPLPDQLACLVPFLDQSLPYYANTLRELKGDGRIALNKNLDLALKSIMEQSIAALGPLIMLQTHAKSGQLSADTVLDLSARAAEFTVRTYRNVWAKRRMYVTQGLTMRSPETDQLCLSTWAELTGADSVAPVRPPDLFGPELVDRIFATPSKVYTVCKKVSKATTAPKTARFAPYRHSNRPNRGGSTAGPSRQVPPLPRGRGAGGSSFTGANNPGPSSRGRAGSRYLNFPISADLVSLPAGRLKHFLKNWLLISRDQKILDISQGYSIEFAAEGPPLQEFPPTPISFDLESQKIIDAEVASLLEKGAVKEISKLDGGFVSKIFIVPKKDGGSRPIIDLSPLNESVAYEHFKMEDYSYLKDLIQHNDFLCKVDLKDAYFSVPIHSHSQKFLRFEWKGKFYQFLVLCFGLASAPRIFTKVMKPLLTLVRHLGIRVQGYIDDFLFANSSPEQLELDVELFCTYAQHLGFTINWAKSYLVPAQQLDYLGLLIDTCQMTFALPQTKVDKIVHTISSVLAKDRVSLRLLAKLLGLFNSSTLAIFPASLYSRRAQVCLKEALAVSDHDWNYTIVLPDLVLQDLEIWARCITEWNGRPIHLAKPSIDLYTDACCTGWGAALGDFRAHGLWSPSERTFHINLLELLAIFNSLRHFESQMPPFTHVRVYADNSTAVAYINRQGGTQSFELNNLARQIWEWVLARKLSVSAEHIPGATNTVADFESRRLGDASDWCLLPSCFRAVTRILGPCKMDLFASRHNAQMRTYVSWHPDPCAWKINAFAHSWLDLQGYAFPPFRLVGQVLHKVMREGATIVLVVPVWPSQPWYPLLLQLACETPLLIPCHDNLLTNAKGDFHPLLLNGTLHLSAWKVSGNRALTDRFLQQLSSCYDNRGVQTRMLDTRQPYVSGMAGVVKDKLIQFYRL